jgi:predicted ATPase
LVDILQAAAVDVAVESKEVRFQFSHDRIQTTAYDLIPSEQAQHMLHLQIVQHLLDEFTEHRSSRHAWHSLLAVDQLNRGSELIEGDKVKRVELAHLNLSAAEQVIKTNSFKMAANFLEKGFELHGVYRWSSQYDLTLQTTHTLASMLFSNGSTNACMYLVEEIYTHARSQSDKQEAQFLEVEILVCNSRLAECINVCFKNLRKLGHRKIPKHPGYGYIVYSYIKVEFLYKVKSDEALLSLPLCKDARILATMRQLGALQSVAFLANRLDLTPIVGFRLIELSLTCGVCSLSPLA